MTCAKIKSALGVSAAIVLAGGATTAVLSNDATGGNLSPSQIFQKAREHYASLTSYRDEGQIVAIMNDAIVTTHFTIRLARTNFYRIEWQQNCESFYSTNNTGAQAAWSSGAGNLWETELETHNDDSRDIALAEAAEVSGGAAGTIPRTFFNMQWGSQLDGSGLDENRQTDEKVGDVDCYVLTRELQGRTKTLWIGKQDFLIHQVRTVTSAEAMQAMLARTADGCPGLAALLQKSNPNFLTTIETHAGIVVNKPFVRSDFLPSIGE